MRGWVSTLQSILGSDAVQVHHYDTHRSALTAHFFQTVLGVAAAPATPHGIVNRSLTATEIAIMREVNARVSSRRAAVIASDELLASPPLGASADSITPDELALLEARFADEVRWLNGVLVEPTLSIQGRVTVGPRPVVPDVSVTARDLAARAEALASN